MTAETTVDTIFTVIFLAIICYWSIRIGLIVMSMIRKKPVNPPSSVKTDFGDFELQFMEGGDDWYWKWIGAKERYKIKIFVNGLEGPDGELLERTIKLVENFEGVETSILDHFKSQVFEKRVLFVLKLYKGILFFDCECSIGSEKFLVSLCEEKNGKITIQGTLEIEEFELSLIHNQSVDT